MGIRFGAISYNISILLQPHLLNDYVSQICALSCVVSIDIICKCRRIHIGANNQARAKPRP